jgi:hypothetical protein
VRLVPLDDRDFEGRVLLGSDGSKAFEGLYLKALGTKCLPRPSRNGYHCYPANAATIDTTRYAEDSCTRLIAYPHSGPGEMGPAWLHPSGCEPQTVAGDPAPEQCHDPRYHELGAPLAGPRFRNAGGMCLGAAEDRPAIVLGAPFPADHFPPMSGSYDSGFAAGPVELGGWGRSLRDRKLDVPCQVRVAADGAYRCLPRQGLALPAGEERGFADPGCQVPLFSMSRDQQCAFEEPAAVSVETRDPGACAAVTRVYKVGQIVYAEEPVYLQDPTTGGCTRRPTDFTYRVSFFRLGDELPPQGFPEYQLRED